MPEGPQMVFLKEQADQFVNQTVLKVSGNAKAIPADKLVGERLTEIKTFGKEILFCFNHLTIRIHLMLFGKYAFNEQLGNRVLRLGLEFETGEINFYACEVKFINEPLDKVYDWSADVLNPAFDKNKALDKLLQHQDQLICEALLDQKIFAGVGNKIKNEVLFRRQIHPESIVGQIPKAELKKLVSEAVKVSYDYLEWKNQGLENEPWMVYKKNECPRDHIPLNREKIGKSGRSSYFCDKCQRLFIEEV